MSYREIKIIYKDDDITRVLRGTKIKEDDIFIVIKRLDGTFWINKKQILRIEEGNDGWNSTMKTNTNNI